MSRDVRTTGVYFVRPRPLAEMDTLPPVPEGWRTVASLDPGERARWEAARGPFGTGEPARAEVVFEWLRAHPNGHHWQAARDLAIRRPEAAEAVRRLCREGRIEATGDVGVSTGGQQGQRVRTWRVRE
jgi:hypothetical protein